LFVSHRSISVLFAEVRQEAVQQALAAMQGRPKPSLPMPSKRTSVMAKSPDRDRRDSGKFQIPFPLPETAVTGFEFKFSLQMLSTCGKFRFNIDFFSILPSNQTKLIYSWKFDDGTHPSIY
jgi:hypothetical protein